MSFDEKVMWRPERVFPLTEEQTKWTSVFILYGLAVAALVLGSMFGLNGNMNSFTLLFVFGVVGVFVGGLFIFIMLEDDGYIRRLVDGVGIRYRKPGENKFD